MGRRNRRDGDRWGTREDHREWTKLAFDYYKQLATLSGVGAAVVLAVYQQDILEEDLLRYALVEFGVAALISMYGMLVLLIRFPYPPPKDERPGTPFLAQMATNFLAAAVVTILLSAVDFPRSVTYVVITAYAMFFLWVFFGEKVLAKVSPILRSKARRWRRR